jgi:hypothetical protein
MSKYDWSSIALKRVILFVCLFVLAWMTLVQDEKQQQTST